MCQSAVERAKDDEKAKLFGAGRGSLDRSHCQFIDTLIPVLLGLAWLGLACSFFGSACLFSQRKIQLQTSDNNIYTPIHTSEK